MSGRRIAHVISTRGIGGAERFLASLVAHGAAEGWDQLVLNPFASPGSAPLASLCAPVPCEARPCNGPRQVPSTRRWLQGRLDSFEPAVVHVVLFHASVAMASVRRRADSCRICTNVYGEGVRTARHAKLIPLIDRWAGRRVDHIAAISQSVRRFLVADYGYPPSMVTCIPLGWEGSPRPRRAQEHPPTIICVGGLRPEKGHDVLLAALAVVRREVPDARLLIVGDGELRPSLESQVAALGLVEAVDFLGSVPDVWPLLAEADLFASASRSEAFGIAIAEAMAAGLPVVAPEVGAIPELVRPGETGELYPGGDHEAMAACVVALLRSPDVRARMSANAEAAAAQLRMDRAVDRYFDLFEAVCGVRGKCGRAKGGDRST